MRLLAFCTKNDPSPRAGMRQGKRILDLRTRHIPCSIEGIATLRTYIV